MMTSFDEYVQSVVDSVALDVTPVDAREFKTFWHFKNGPSITTISSHQLSVKESADVWEQIKNIYQGNHHE